MDESLIVEKCDYQDELLSVLNGQLGEIETLVEPYFDISSPIIASIGLDVKVKVINDVSGGLVRLFEMFRVDPAALLDLVREDRDIETFNQENSIQGFFNKSPFLKDISDIKYGLAAIFKIFRLFEIEKAGCDQDFLKDTLSRVHHNLKGTLVENLPVIEFIGRFDKPYTLCFIPSSEVESFIHSAGVKRLVPGLVGRFLFNVSPDQLHLFKGGFEGRNATQKIHVNFSFSPFKEYFLFI